MAETRVRNNDLAPDVARANLLVNGGLEIWQRGAGAFTAHQAYTADRWQILLGGSSTISVSKETSTVDGGSAAALKAVYSHNTNSQIDQKLEDHVQLRGRSVSFSARVRQGVAGNARAYISDSGTKSYSSTSSTTGAYVTLTVTLAIGASSSGVSVGIDLGAGDTVYLDNAMLVAGTVPTDYVPLTPAEEWARCQRYYECIGFSAGYSVNYAGYAVSGTDSGSPKWSHSFAARKAVTPTLTKAGTWGTNNCAQPAASCMSLDQFCPYAIASGPGLIQFTAYGATQGYIAEANP